jgi:hypothetical protein
VRAEHAADKCLHARGRRPVVGIRRHECHLAVAVREVLALVENPAGRGRVEWPRGPGREGEVQVRELAERPQARVAGLDAADARHPRP